ncbi:DEKNAAC104264 [Brettanomyces naardenensis]|uniref:DEKNAAC104264 n=1 Tax=Brettanomyces naardenensis TaxID=13370 RepID=A0A448YPY9_BRENA|nr:DEKNAAC104264 [Brettanomyces naardenensis]
MAVTIPDVVAQLEGYLSLPTTIDYSQFPPSLVNGVCDDCSVLSCGCLLSENLAKQLSVPKEHFKCPVCQNKDSRLLKPCDSVRSIAKYLLSLKATLESEDTTDSHGEQAQQQQEQPNLTFLSAFNEVFTEVNRSDYNDNNYSYKSSTGTSQHSYNSRDLLQQPQPSQPSLRDETSTSPTSNSTVSSIQYIQKQRTRSSFQASNLTKLLSASPKFEKVMTHNKNSQQQQPKETNKELIFGKNFPFFRKLYQYHIHHSKFFPKTKLFINTGISPGLTRLALLSEKKFEVFSIDPDSPEASPELLCCGKNDGEYGPSYDVHRKISKEDIVRSSNFADSAQDSLELLSNWEHISCKVTENLLVIAGTRGFLRVLDLTCDGRCLYTYQCKFPIRCIDVSPDEKFISLGVTGKDKYTLVEQAFVILLRLEIEDATVDAADSVSVNESSATTNSGVSRISSTAASLFHPVTSGSSAASLPPRRSLRLTAFPFNLPYRDPITILQFSPNSRLLTVATALESRFLTISIADPSRPALVMKSQRKLDTSLESEGITDVQFFPDNRVMTLTSVAYNSVPIVIDTNITSISGTEGIAKPKLLLKVDEVGNTIHKCCASPRGDSVAYLDRSGTVYIMMCPKMGDSDNKRIVIVTDVANSYTSRESASMRFDRSGYKLYILDRKGLLTIADFTAGTVEDHSVTRCKIIS